MGGNPRLYVYVYVILTYNFYSHNWFSPTLCVDGCVQCFRLWYEWICERILARCGLSFVHDHALSHAPILSLRDIFLRVAWSCNLLHYHVLRNLPLDWIFPTWHEHAFLCMIVQSQVSLRLFSLCFARSCRFWSLLMHSELSLSTEFIRSGMLVLFYAWSCSPLFAPRLIFMARAWSCTILHDHAILLQLLKNIYIYIFWNNN